MSLSLTAEEQAIAAGRDGEGAAIAMRIVAETAALMGAPRLIRIESAHIDGALYHGDSGTLFAEKLVEGGAKVAVRATLNVGALDLMGCSKVRLEGHERAMARRMMDAYRKLGCEPSWTCAPYQAGHRPALGSDVAWGESNAVVFCNSVLGARTNRYGDFLDIACAICGRAPDYGLHRAENRRARLVFDVSALPRVFLRSEAAWPVLGSLYGRETGNTVGVVTGVDEHPGEDALKAFGAAAASSGAVGLFHIAGVTPEAPEAETALGGETPETVIRVTPDMVAGARAGLSTAGRTDRIDAVAIGSPHLSIVEFEALERLIGGRTLRVPIYACTGRHALADLEKFGRRKALEAAGVTIVADTCVVVTPILPALSGGVLMTNSGKFAHYAPGNTGYGVLYGSLAECVESAVAGKPVFSDLVSMDLHSKNTPSPQEGGQSHMALPLSVALRAPPLPKGARNPSRRSAGIAISGSSPHWGEVSRRSRDGEGSTPYAIALLQEGRGAQPETSTTIGETLILTAPISFWGGVDPKTGRIADVRHPQHGQSIAGKVLFLPGTIGSSSASAVLLELVRSGHAPAALVLHEPDAILLLGLIVAREMGWETPTALRLDRNLFEGFGRETVSVDRGGHVTPSSSSP